MTSSRFRAAARGFLLRAAAFVLSAVLLSASCSADDIVFCRTLAQALAAGRAAEEKTAERLRLSLPEEVLLSPRRVHEDKGIKGEWDLDDALWNMIYIFPSVYKMSYGYVCRDGLVRADLYFYYRDGVRLMRAVSDGAEEELSDEEAAALAAARDIVARLPSAPPRERLLALCRALCAALSFLSPGGAGDVGDVNSCLTALASGRANCQGYADVFFLCASLAGFEVRYRNGWNRAGESHTWNRVLMDGAWLDTDLMWMDAPGGVSETYFLMDPSALLEGHVPEESAWPGLEED